VLAAIICACALVQVHFILAEPAAPGAAAGPRRVAAELFLPAIARRVGGSVVLGSLMAPSTGVVAGTIVGIATLAGVGYMAFRPGALRTERCLLGLAFAVLVLGALVRTRYALGEYFKPLADGRYVYLPQLIAIWLLIATACTKGLAGRVSAALLVLGLLGNLPTYREPAYADLHWERYAPHIRAGERVTVPVNPPGWLMPLPARRK
jgi:hypothetical protein